MRKGSKMTEEAKRKMSKSRMGESPWNKGKKLTEEHKRKLSENHRTKRGCSSPMKGKHYSEEVRKKNSEAQKKECLILKKEKSFLQIELLQDIKEKNILKNLF